jgi:hypothetical protein
MRRQIVLSDVRLGLDDPSSPHKTGLCIRVDEGAPEERPGDRQRVSIEE